MKLPKLVIRSFLHYLRVNLLAAGGLAIAAAVITGAFIIGESLKHSLEKAVDMRLGSITHSVTAGERLFTAGMGERFSQLSGITVSTALVAEGMVISEGGRDRLNRVQVIGADDNFSKVLNTKTNYAAATNNQVIISRNLANRLQLEPGDFFMLRMKSAGVIPMNTPLVSDAGQTVTRRVQVASVAEDDDYGRFNLRVSQTAPFNVFVSSDWLNRVMDLDRMANALFFDAGDAMADDLEQYLQQACSPADANLIIRHRDFADIIEISSERVFIDEQLSDRLTRILPGATGVLTYFANSIEKGDKATPYSFIAATEGYNLKPGQTAINSWLASDLDAAAGDTLIVRYFETGPRRELTEQEITLMVTDIIDMEKSAADSILMPFLPGLSDAGSCRDWDAGVPVSLEKIRDKDEEYWQKYRGTPKAYISLEQGQELWSNRFGNLTSIWLSGKEAGLERVKETVTESLAGAVDPLRMGFRINHLREDGILAAAGGVDFGMLFGGLGFFVMIAGVMLYLLLTLFNLQQRSQQIRLFSSMGFQLPLIRKIYLGEGLLVAAAGSLAGLLLAAGYAKLVQYGLAEVWQDIVRTDLIEIVITPLSLSIGLLISLTVAIVVTITGVNRYILKKRLQENQPHQARNYHSYRLTLIAAIVFTCAGIVVLLLQLLPGYQTGPAGFFISGGLILPGALLFVRTLLTITGNMVYLKTDMIRLSLKNLTRNSNRSMIIIILLAMGVFVIIATGSFRKDASTDLSAEGGTGGFLFIGESTVPVLHNLNSPGVRLDLNIPAEVSFVQFMSGYGDDASCLNLNEVANPRILATDPSSLEGRFSFATGRKSPGDDNPWQMLNKELSRHNESSIPVIPAIADKAVIEWGLNKRVGDTLIYIDEQGDEVGLRLTGALENSVFQGNVLISEENFLRHFPSTSGSTFFLADAPAEKEEELKDELNYIFRDHGWQMTTTAEKLDEFNSVENTYLGIFMMLGAFGVLLGVAGLAVVMARGIAERRSEIALYNSLGYKRVQIISIICREHIILLIGGVVAGTLPALIAVLPTLVSGSQQADPVFLLVLIASITLNGIFWIAVTSLIMIKDNIFPDSN